MFKAIVLFTDLQDGNHKYMPGDEYPRHGLKPTQDRINELLTGNNRRGIPMIAEVKPDVEPVEAPADEKTEPVDKPKRKRAKKAPEGK